MSELLQIGMDMLQWSHGLSLLSFVAASSVEYYWFAAKRRNKLFLLVTTLVSIWSNRLD